MIKNEVIETKTSHEKRIKDNIYNFDISVLSTGYFNNKNETLLKTIKNIKVNGVESNKKQTETLVFSIREDAKKYINEYSAFDSFKTENQHYVKNQIQKNWDKSDCVIFEMKGDVIDDKIFDFSLTETSLINYDNIPHNKSKFESNKTFVKKYTFDIYGEDYFIYLEDGIVTILEKLFERIIDEYSSDDLMEIKKTKEINIMKYFFVPYLSNRIENYQEFAINIASNYNIPKVITNFLELKSKNFSKNYKIFVKNSYDNLFNLTSDWIEYLFYVDLYDECAINLSRPVIMPYSPTKALLIIDDVALKYFKKYQFDKEDFLINAILGIIDKMINTSDDGEEIVGNHYKFDTLIRLADKKNTMQIMDTLNNLNNSSLVENGKFKELSHKIVTIWRDKNLGSILAEMGRI